MVNEQSVLINFVTSLYFSSVGIRRTSTEIMAGGLFRDPHRTGFSVPGYNLSGHKQDTGEKFTIIAQYI